MLVLLNDGGVCAKSKLSMSCDHALSNLLVLNLSLEKRMEIVPTVALECIDLLES